MTVGSRYESCRSGMESWHVNCYLLSYEGIYLGNRELQYIFACFTYYEIGVCSSQHWPLAQCTFILLGPLVL